jgi:cobalamin biosynthesis protein CobD/CbiB
LLAALLADHAWPLREEKHPLLWLKRWAAVLEGALNAGQYRHGVLAWVLVIGATVGVTAWVQCLADDFGWPASMAWSIAVLFLTTGFRQFRLAFAEVERALRAGELATARETLGRWRRASAAELNAGETARVAIEQGLLAAHREVFGPIIGFIVLGPAGAVLYRVCAVLSDLWDPRNAPDLGAFGAFAARAFFWIDWLPARLTAASFAAAGDFADAVYCWRAQAAAWTPRADGIILASGGGALGVRLGDSLHQDGGLHDRPELGTGDAVDVDHLQQALGLIWRALVLWLFLVFLVSLAHALG